MILNDDSKQKIRLATIVYWVLLLYIIAALVWWALALERQNETMYQLRMQQLHASLPVKTAAYDQKRLLIEGLRKRNIAMYAGEGGLFLIMILIGAVFIYQSVRRQFRLTQQQQNFVMAITHELKTPIAVSRLNLETLQKYKLEDSKKERLLQMTLQETMRLDTLINNILISSQLDVKSYRLSKNELNFSDLTEDIIHQFKARYPDRLIKCTIHEEIDIYGDTILLKLLISNLLENANKYSPKETAISLSLGKNDHFIFLEISDHGPGIPEAERKNIFEKFYRIGNEQTRKTKGTGLGLYICKKIAEDHNGTIVIKDNPPQGSTFIVNFAV